MLEYFNIVLLAIVARVGNVAVFSCCTIWCWTILMLRYFNDALVAVALFNAALIYAAVFDVAPFTVALLNVELC